MPGPPVGRLFSCQDMRCASKPGNGRSSENGQDYPSETSKDSIDTHICVDKTSIRAQKDAKSKKRCAAEALLEKKAKRKCGARNEYLSNVWIEKCNKNCVSCEERAQSGSKSGKSVERWCSMQVTIKAPFHWQSLVDGDLVHISSGISGKIYNLKSHVEETGVELIVVETMEELEAAITRLKESMLDNVIAIDLEWRPDNKYTNNSVALIQLASSSCCVLLRFCKLGDRLPATLIKFFTDTRIYFVGFSWDTNDESKMKRTFNVGKEIFSTLIDVQKLGMYLGYPSFGLGQLTERVLGSPVSKQKSISRSDWQAERLRLSQIKYAALDALATGHIFRMLRTWHASPEPCLGCSQPLGIKGYELEIDDTCIKCRQCGKTCQSWHSFICHTAATGHQGGLQQCTTCGRMQKT
eukprot:jgi/Picsp_1/1254/NSC_04735-R1_3 -5 exonuclease